jgi:hypothetical protein
MATYCFFGESDGMGVAYDAPGYEGCLRRRVDLPHLIANPGKLALAASPTIPLTTFAGFVQNDVLELFQVREMIEATAAALLATRRDAAVLKGLTAMAADMRSAVENGDLDRYS